MVGDWVFKQLKHSDPEWAITGFTAGKLLGGGGMGSPLKATPGEGFSNSAIKNSIRANIIVFCSIGLLLVHWRL